MADLLQSIAALLLPVVILVLGVIYREPLIGLCRNLKRLKYKEWAEAEWHQPLGQDGSTADPGQPTDLESARIEMYTQSAGLFLVHDLRPSSDPRQLFDVGLFIVGHADQTTGKTPPLREVDRVEYQLGSKFNRKPIAIKDPEYGFRLNTSAYGPFACVARVCFKDSGRVPLILRRYVDFENA